MLLAASADSFLRAFVYSASLNPYSLTNSTYKSLAAGAGVIYKIDSNYSYIITNYHVVETNTTSSGIASSIKVFQYGADTSITANEPSILGYGGSNYYYSSYTFSDSAIDATYIGGSSTYDIAVLKVQTNKLASFAQPVTIADGYKVAETAIAIGNPNGEGTSVTQGIVSVESEEISFSDFEIFRVMRIDTAVNGGNSGGGLFNINGELIGIVNAKIEDSKIDNIAYALPYDNITKVADNILYYYSGTAVKVKKLDLNIDYAVENQQATYNASTGTFTITSDYVVKHVYSSGFGKLLQLASGDIIKSVKINNSTPIEITRAYELDELLLTVRPGDKLLITVQRGNSTLTIGSSSISVTNQYLELCD